MRRITCNSDAHQMLNDIIENYKTKSRAISADGTCAYEYGGNRCALGMMMTEEDLEEIKRLKMNIGSGVSDINKIFNFTKQEYQIFKMFQTLHDSECHWETEEGGELTEQGLTEVDYIRKQINSILPKTELEVILQECKQEEEFHNPDA